MATFKSLLESRSYLSDDGKLVPHFWRPEPMVKKPYTLFADDTMLVDESWNIDKVIQKIISLGLFLEMPVGEWVLEGRKRELSNLPKEALTLLQTNISDETAHDKGFKFAAKAYPVSSEIMNEASVIAEAWLSNKEHPLQKACFAETGVFLISLGVMRLVGGESLCSMAEQIARDESRHVSTNRGVLNALGMSVNVPPTSISNLVTDTLDWFLDGFSVPGDDIAEDFDFNKDFLMRSSASLIATGLAPAFDSVLNFQVHTLPFEVGNAKVYSRTTEV